MKTLLNAVVLSTLFLFAVSCDDQSNQLPEELVGTVTQGKMLLSVDNGEQLTLNCTFSREAPEDAGEWEGKITINGQKSSTDGEITMNFFYGEYGNVVALTTKTYTTSDSERLLILASTYGGTSDAEIVSLTITEINSTGIKGYFEGELLVRTGKLPVQGAFWATTAL